MDRRSFLRIGVSAATGVAIALALPSSLQAAIAESLPVIYGDWEHDDAPGLQAAIDGTPFLCASGLVVASAGRVVIRDGSFTLDSGLYFHHSPDRPAVRIEHCELRGRNIRKGEATLNFAPLPEDGPYECHQINSLVVL
jgi:hypothetical protein